MLRVEIQHPLRSFALEAALEVEPGSCLALVGPSGAGKTSILRAIAGLVRPRRGRIECGAKVWLDSERNVALAPEQRRCGMVFQDYALFPHLSAWRNVAYGLRETDRKQRRPAALALLERFGAGALADERPARLSGGERQRVALARALARRPDALLLDEPLTALDPHTRDAARHVLTELLADAGVPAILVTHDFTEAAVLGDRIAVLDAGRVVQSGTAAELVAAPAGAFVASLTGASVVNGIARPHPEGLTAVALEGGGDVFSTDTVAGPVSVVIRPEDVTLEAAGAAAADSPASAQNRLPAAVVSVTPVANRLRVGLALPAPLTAEVTALAGGRLGLVQGARVLATWKATATRLVPR